MELLEAINKSLDVSEIELSSSINAMTREMSDDYYTRIYYRKHERPAKEILQTVWHNKVGDKKNIEYGYVASVMGEIAVFMHRLGIKSICDMGCGAGLSLYSIKQYAKDIEVYGYDNEDALLDLASEIFGERLLKNRDITKLEKGDVRSDSLIYIYEPIYDKSLCKIFIDGLCEILMPNQLVFCRNINSVTGFSFEHLSNRVDMELVVKITPNVPAVEVLSVGAIFKKC